VNHPHDLRDADCGIRTCGVARTLVISDAAYKHSGRAGARMQQHV